ncbi:hypothetical protein Sjap_025571 [Stephania japonica]|uniref:F-box domain-containing protein n=1 Tax=Stephania japonica TaxID=461633 RepID=A0AAP0E4J1_9MAGN
MKNMKNNEKNKSSSWKNKKNNRKNKSSYSDFLNDDFIIYEIIARLPVKSVFRFKAVCKNWNDIISHSPSFSACHFRKGLNATNFNGSALFSKKRQYVISSDPSFHQFNLSNPDYALTVHSSSHGLLYGTCSWYSQMYIYNPITKHEPIYIPNPKRGLYMALAYDPYNNPSFGFAIVVISPLKEENNWWEFEVYSSKTYEWRVSNAQIEISSFMLLRGFNAVFSRGYVYWSVESQKKFEWERKYIVRLPEIVQQNWEFLKRYFNPKLKVRIRDAAAKSLACGDAIAKSLASDDAIAML